MSLELHPLCTLFPRLEGAEFDALKADIAANGLRSPIVLHDGLILDGGNRYRACVEAGAEPSFEQFKGPSVVAFVLSANLHRRHLSAGQQAAIVASAQDWANANIQGRNFIRGNVASDGISARQALSGASRRTQLDADKVAREDPELAKQVAQGKVPLSAAVKKVRSRKPMVEKAISKAAQKRLDKLADVRGKQPVAKKSDPFPEDGGYHGPSDEEIAELTAEAEVQQHAFRTWVAADGANEAMVAEMTRLKAEVNVVKSARDGAMNKCNELIARIKSLLRKMAKAGLSG